MTIWLSLLLVASRGCEEQYLYVVSQMQGQLQRF